LFNHGTVLTGIIDIINQLNDNAKATVDIPLESGEMQRYNCLLRQVDSVQIKLVFPPNFLKPEHLHYEGNCRLIVKHGESAVNLNVHIDSAFDNRTLLCTALESINPESLREYFRVMISTPISASYRPGPKEIKHRSWKLVGQSIDLSGGGVLALFPGKPENNLRIHLELNLPGQSAPITCMAKVVRTYRMRKKRYQVAFHIVDIEGKARDLIISCCLQEQRRQLRDKVRVE